MQKLRPLTVIHTAAGVAAHCADVELIPRNISVTETMSASAGVAAATAPAKAMAAPVVLIVQNFCIHNESDMVRHLRLQSQAGHGRARVRSNIRSFNKESVAQINAQLWLLRDHDPIVIVIYPAGPGGQP
jgi:hypothetical protein